MPRKGKRGHGWCSDRLKEFDRIRKQIERITNGGDRRELFRCLELCCGTKSFLRAVRRRFTKSRCVTVDVNPKFAADVIVDVINWIAEHRQGWFDVIWISPPCKEYSNSKTVGVRDIKGADAVAMSCLVHLEALDPLVYFIENPQSSMLWKRPFMKTYLHGIYTCTYCMYGKLYMKPTNICSNIHLELRRCAGECRCEHVQLVYDEFGHFLHPHLSQSGDKLHHCGFFQKGTPELEAATVPENLVDDLLDQALTWMERQEHSRAHQR